MNTIVSVIIALLVGFFTVPGIESARADDTAGSKKELSRIKRQMREKQKELKRADRKERSILTELDRIDRDIQAGEAELASQQRLLRETEAALRDTEKNNQALSRELEASKEAYRMRVRSLYKMSRSGYVDAVLGGDGLDDALRRMKYLAIITDRDRSVIRGYGAALEKSAARQTEIAEKKKAISERKRAVETRKAFLESRKKNRAILLTSVRGKKTLYEQTLRELEDSSTTLWAMIRKAERERPQAPEPAKQKTSSVRPETPVAAPFDRGRLPWPVDGRVMTRFGMQRHPQFGTMVFRRGIEIEAREGEPVKSVGDGQVVYADWYRGYGKLVIIEHRTGFYSLYGNLSQVNLSKGDKVAKGQVIGLAGDTGSLKGSKLYFEIRENGEAKDPLTRLARR